MRRGARAPAGACVAALLAVAAAYDPMEPEDEDMPDIDDEVAVGGDPATEKQQEEKGAPDDDAASGGATAAAANAAVFQYMSTKELQGILLKRGIDAREEGLVEKAELVARVVESAAAAGSGAKPAAGQRRAASSSRRQSRAGSGRSGESARVVIKYCAS